MKQRAPRAPRVRPHRVLPRRTPAEKLAIIRAAAARYSFPVADIDPMLAEIARGYV